MLLRLVLLALFAVFTAAASAKTTHTAKCENVDARHRTCVASCVITEKGAAAECATVKCAPIIRECNKGATGGFKPLPK